MPDAALPESVLAELRKLDTPTVCNALEVVAPERRSIGFTVKPLVCAVPDLPPIVGYARTATIRAAAPDPRRGEEARRYRLQYYAYVEAGPRPTIMVIQDLDVAKAGFGAFWGEVQSHLHRALGCLGAVTDGSIRDLGVLAKGFQLLAGMVAPSHAHVHLVGFGEEVSVAGMTVRSGDLVHADRHGAVVRPHAAAPRVAAAAAVLGRREAVILEAAKRPGFSAAALQQALGEADDIH
ncbi:MAG: RraA family protein [Pseudomonadota bacterium]